ncbi:hypothetical protein HanIR_Chr12g0563051 [Helianthus annuus]|nr:hypothetical protein HanIR_Chr12g0563051 [Helianthus annuus]KAJ0503836.1 hypothetical protein HanHA89_Chr12g0452761 [Helianthus annuus]KAJ0673522.1 hypothetical protein HanLR1_Chr12g0430121 [Helianthus annuus]
MFCWKHDHRRRLWWFLVRLSLSCFFPLGSWNVVIVLWSMVI